MFSRLLLPAVLEQQLWAHVRRLDPQEGVGLLGGLLLKSNAAQAQALYPLENVAADPQREYRAEAAGLLRALFAMRREGLALIAIYHSHPHGPAGYSRSDELQAAYEVPYLIADLSSNSLSAFWLPGGAICELRRE